MVAGLIEIPLMVEVVVKLLTHYGNIESYKYYAINPSQSVVIIPPVRAYSFVSPPTTVYSSY